MGTLNEIKNEVAKEHGYVGYLDVFEFSYALCDEVAKRYAISACEDLRERIAETAKVNFDCNVWNCEGQSVNKDSIISVEIILK